MSKESREQVVNIVDALGGIGNISAVEPCVTRLRFEVHNPEQVSLAAFKPPVCYGATVVGTAVQVIVGPQAELLADELREHFHSQA